MSAPVVLVAEDSLVVRAVLREQLAAQGYEVVEAEDGEEAIEQSRQCHPDVVLLDIEMPNVDGHQVLATLKGDPELADIPVVVLSGRVTTGDAVEGLRRGAHDYLRKPFEPSELLARVSAALRTKALQDELRRSNAELAVAARTDWLTGIANRRHLGERLRAAAEETRRRAGPLAVLMVDIDRFKEVNDRHGHAVGDEVLCAVAARLAQLLRPVDLVGRWGGEEFLVVLPGLTGEGAAALGEEVRRLVEGEPVAAGDGRLGVTVSVGAASSTDGDWEALARAADDALYEAKAAGRNTVRLSHETARTEGSQRQPPRSWR